MALLERADELGQFRIALDLRVDLREELAALLAKPVRREDQPGGGSHALKRSDRREGIVGVGEVVRNEQHKPGRGVGELPEPVLDQVKRGCRHLGTGLPHRHRLNELRAVAADGDADRAGVRHRHRDRVDPGCRGDTVFLNHRQHSRGESLPLEVGLIAGEQQEGLADFVLREVQLQFRGLVVAQVVLIEVHRGAACPVVQQFVVVEGQHGAVLKSLEKVLADLADRVARIRESGQASYQVEAVGHLNDIA